ncbi:MAG TPA: Glu-tRNA(Gln) amidotransferase subunit GatE [Nitrososphaeraceae archaeon]
MTTNPLEISLKVGLEIHQQLATGTKLFCQCESNEDEEYTLDFSRSLRPAQSELGIIDPAALFEFKKIQSFKYCAANVTSCLVEADEEPPHCVNREALESALIFSLALNSRIVDEIHVMRKIVIDGSNTSGFQRTMLISMGGFVEINGKRTGVQSICLEEDAAKLISDNNSKREFGLDRLGIPLVEIALEPISGTPYEVMQLALGLGRILRASKRVARGIGSIRQDVNISVENGRVVEIKGVQKLDQLIKVIEYEVNRQHGLIVIADKLKNERGIKEIRNDNSIVDVTDILKGSSSKKIIESLKDQSTVYKAIRIERFAGMLGFEPYDKIRLGKELSQLVRFYGIGGIFHSDELPGYGISKENIDSIEKKLAMSSKDDAFIIIGGRLANVTSAIESLIQRLKVVLDGVPAETRAATQLGETVYIRPRPGSARMYPETDIPPIKVDNLLLDYLRQQIPRPIEEYTNELLSKFGLNNKLAEEIFDSQYLNLFEKIVSSTKISPTFVASKLTEDITNLERQGFDSSLLTEKRLIEIFNELDKGRIAKESVTLLFEKFMKREINEIDEFESRFETMTEQQLEDEIEGILTNHLDVIRDKGVSSLGMLMGRTMAVLKGRSDGQNINAILKRKLEQKLAFRDLRDR